jgi:hypothetical protein
LEAFFHEMFCPRGWPVCQIGGGHTFIRQHMPQKPYLQRPFMEVQQASLYKQYSTTSLLVYALAQQLSLQLKGSELRDDGLAGART